MIEKYLRKMKKRNSRTEVLDCEMWKALVKEAKTHIVL